MGGRYCACTRTLPVHMYTYMYMYGTRGNSLISEIAAAALLPLGLCTAVCTVNMYMYMYVVKVFVGGRPEERWRGVGRKDEEE